MYKLKRCFAIGGSAAVVSVLAIAMTSVAATVETYKNLATGYCLDSNTARNVYTNPCGRDNSFQKWTVIRVGSNRMLKNLATGYCLDSNTARNVYTNRCGNDNSFQKWTVIRVGSNLQFKNLATGYCLDSNTARNVYTNPCGRDNSFQKWY
jgi:serine/threonine-protein kinase